MLQLTAEELRVVGALVEKQLTTPQQYPLTLNATVAACNQTSSRNPIVAYTDRQVEAVLSVLKDKRLVRFVHPSHGRSVTRYRQVLEEVLGIEERQLALLAVLFLRGPQTAGEVRARTERMAEFAGVDHVEEELEILAVRDEPLVARLPREPGRKEARYAHLLAGEDDASLLPAPPPSAAWRWATAEGRPEPRPDAAAPAAAPRPPAGEPPRPLASQVAVLQAEVAALRRDLDEVLARLGMRAARPPDQPYEASDQ